MTEPILRLRVSSDNGDLYTQAAGVRAVIAMLTEADSGLVSVRELRKAADQLEQAALMIACMP